MCRYDHDRISDLDRIGSGRNDDFAAPVDKRDQKIGLQRKVFQCFSDNGRRLFDTEFDRLCTGIEEMVEDLDLAASGGAECLRADSRGGERRRAEAGKRTRGDDLLVRA